MSGSPRDGNRSPDLKGNAPLPDAARVAVACVPTGATALRCSTPSPAGFLLLPPSAVPGRCANVGTTR
ncbi:hypothetical protein IE980_16520 [Klebsiella pneumoniae]|uniref:Uncharacterized protein n=1 Tax=Klebsiella pneumoniae TaxID=573 RepID=A0A927E753_KLEPN|nr:hypothetical protein [Klebsiella pneumoniae]